METQAEIPACPQRVIPAGRGGGDAATQAVLLLLGIGA